MKETSLLDIIESIYSQYYAIDDEIPTDELEELLKSIEVVLRERDGE